MGTKLTFLGWSTGILLSVLLLGVRANQQLLTAEHKLYHKLFTSYNIYTRPVKNASDVVMVSILFSLMQINTLNDKMQVLTTTGCLYIKWVDEFLMWDPSEFGGIKKLVMLPEKVWLPDIGVKNSAISIYDSSHRTEYRVIIDYRGNVLWVPGGQFATSCTLDITYYPYDHQKCRLIFTNWVYPGNQVNLTYTTLDGTETGAGYVDLTDYTTSGEWSVEGTNATRRDLQYEDPYPLVTFTVVLKRKFWYHIINIMAPCAMMSGLILLVFWLPPDSGEKIGLGITVLLSFSVFLMMISSNLPQTSDSLPIIGFYLMSFMLMSSSSIVVTVLVLNLHHAKGDKPVPWWVRRVVFNVLARAINYSGPRSVTLQEIKSGRRGKGSGKDTRCLMNEASNFSEDMIQSPPPILVNNLNNHNLDSMAAEEKMQMTGVEQCLLKNMEKILDQSANHDKEEAVIEEWHTVATILDRFFFQLFLVLVAICTLVMLIIIPVMQQ